MTGLLGEEVCHNTVIWGMGNKLGSMHDMASGNMDMRGKLKTASAACTSSQSASEVCTNSPACTT